MLGHSPFYHQHVRKYITCFGTLFNDIAITRKSKKGTDKTIKCPIIYSTKNRQLNRLIENPVLNETWESVFPRLSFELTGMTYASNRKENTIHYSLNNAGDGRARLLSYSPAPYDFTFQLVVYSLYLEDLLQIIEQIIPFFQPEYCIKVKEIPSLGLVRDVVVVLTGITAELDRTGSYTENTNPYTATLEFTLKGFFYGPAEEKPVITNLESNLWYMPEGLVSTYTAEGDLATKELVKEEWYDYSSG